MKKFFFLILLMGCMSSQEIYNVNKYNNKFIYGESIKLFFGDEILVEADVDGKSIKNFRIVDSIVDSSKTISISMFKGSDGPNATTLFVQNPFDLILNYKAKIRTFSRREYTSTSIIPIYPKIFCMELWPYTIESIILYDFKLSKVK